METQLMSEVLINSRDTVETNRLQIGLITDWA